jgi:hypothetical protein
VRESDDASRQPKIDSPKMPVVPTARLAMPTRSAFQQSQMASSEQIERSRLSAVRRFTMMKTTGTALVAVAVLLTSSTFAEAKAGDKACCIRTAANNEKQPCADLTALNLTADQKTKIEAWQAECVQAGCTKQSRHKFFQQAKGILSPEQFAKLKAECKKNWASKQTKTEA